MLVYSLATWMMGRTVIGWTSLMAVLTLLGSVQLVVLGIFGEYLGTASTIRARADPSSSSIAWCERTPPMRVLRANHTESPTG